MNVNILGGKRLADFQWKPRPVRANLVVACPEHLQLAEDDPEEAAATLPRSRRTEREVESIIEAAPIRFRDSQNLSPTGAR